MECRNVVESLSDYVDGLLPDSELGMIEGHLVSCGPCKNVKLGLSEIRTAARELPLHTPPRAMWTRISNALAAELEAETKPRRTKPIRPQTFWQRLRAREFTFSLPQLAGAGAFALALLFFAGVGLNRSSNLINVAGVQTAFLPGEDRIKQELEQRLASIKARMAKWDAQRRSEFEQRLAKIEDAINSCRVTLQANAEDQHHQQMLLNLYDEKRQLLDDVERLKW